MRFAVTILFCLSLLDSVNARQLFCSPTGNDNNAGTQASPFASWEKLASVLVAGDTGYVRGGTYRTAKAASSSAFCRIDSRSGTAGNYIKMWAYPGEFPVFNLDNINSTATPTAYIVFMTNCSFWYIRGLHVTSLIQRSSSNYPFGWYMTNGSGNILEQCESDHNSYGFSFDKQTNLQVTNCDAHDNQDPLSPAPFNGSDGFGSNGGQPSTTSIIFKGCRSWWNGDDGYDLFRNDGTITFDSCWSFRNGYIPGSFSTAGNGDGYKLGPNDVITTSTIKHFVWHCLAFDNRFNGYDQNNGITANQLYNNIAFRNVAIGYHFNDQSAANPPNTLRNNVWFQANLAGGTAISTTPSLIQSNNTWNGLPATTASFASIDTAGVSGPRGANGSLPNLAFLHLSAGSNLINVGVNVGFPFSGSAPDLGPYEFATNAATINKIFGLKR